MFQQYVRPPSSRFVLRAKQEKEEIVVCPLDCFKDFYAYNVHCPSTTDGIEINFTPYTRASPISKARAITLLLTTKKKKPVST